MDEAFVKVMIDGFIKELIKEGKGIFSNLYQEGKNFLGTSVKKYLEKQKQRFSNIKTLLKGNTPVYLYDIYYPLMLLEENFVLPTNKIEPLFAKGNYLTVIGDAGSGKSTLVKHLFLTAINEKFAIPVLIELRYLNGTKGNLEEYITSQIFENKLSENSKILERLYEGGKFLFFLDGFDELNSEVRKTVIESLNNFISIYDQNKFIVTTRPYSNIENLPIFRNLSVKNLNEDEINGFIDLQLKTEPELAEKIKVSLRESKSVYIKSFLTNPLLLTLYILTFQTYAEIPDKKYIFYRRVINALFSEHDSKTKLGYVREKLSQLNQEQFEEILKAFSFLTYFDEHFDFDFDYINSTLKKIKQKLGNITFDSEKFVHDLKSAIALWVEDNGKYAFAHRSLQEYFAASFIKNLNPADNERAYKKIINKYSDNHLPLAEYRNFLSLCNEMDEINFYEHYYLPLLRELRSTLDNSSREKLISSFVAFFTKEVIVGDNYERRDDIIIRGAHIVINPNIYKTIYIHLPFTRKLYDALQHSFADNGGKKSNTKSTESPVSIKYSGLALINHCTDSSFYQIATQFLTFLEKEIEEKEKFIKQSLKSDRDLLDLIK